MVLRLASASEMPRGPVEIQIVGLHLRVSDSVGPGWGLSICISIKFLGDADAAGLGTTLWKPLG